MARKLHTLVDVGASTIGRIAAPAFLYLSENRKFLPRFQHLSDRLGFQIRTAHYYEPTYREDDLPENTRVERSLPGLDLNEDVQLAWLAQLRFADELAAIPLEKPSDAEFGYLNPMYSFGDAEALYSIVRLKRPGCVLEIGSGQSTLMTRLALAANRREDPAYACEHVCIEPYEADWLEGTGVRVIRERVETLDLSLFDALGENDILFIDSSHVIRPFGDVLREYHEIIPRLASGVLVHVHDIFTPRDYPEHWLRAERRLWNEQYLLESFLAFNSTFEVIFATNWLKHHHPEPLHKAFPMLACHPDAEPGAFWMLCL